MFVVVVMISCCGSGGCDSGNNCNIRGSGPVVRVVPEVEAVELVLRVAEVVLFTCQGYVHYFCASASVSMLEFLGKLSTIVQIVHD